MNVSIATIRAMRTIKSSLKDSVNALVHAVGRAPRGADLLRGAVLIAYSLPVRNRLKRSIMLSFATYLLREHGFDVYVDTIDRLPRAALNDLYVSGPDGRHVKLQGDKILRWGVDRVDRMLAAREDSRNVQSVGLALAKQYLHSECLTDAARVLRRARKCEAVRGHATIVHCRVLMAARRFASVHAWYMRCGDHLSDSQRRSLSQLRIQAAIEQNDLVNAERLLGSYEERWVADSFSFGKVVELAYRKGDYDALYGLLLSGYVRARAIKGPVFQWLRYTLYESSAPATALPGDVWYRLLELSRRVQSKLEHQRLCSQASGPGVLESDEFRAWLKRASEAKRGYSLSAGVDSDVIRIALDARAYGCAAGVASGITSHDRRCKMLDSSAVWRLEYRRATAFFAMGDAESAHSCILNGLDRIILKRAWNTGHAAWADAVKRFPASGAVLDRLIIISERSGHERMRAATEAWRNAYASNADIGQEPISEWSGVGAGRRCFIVGNGPSVSSMRLSLLEGEDVFVVNRGEQARSLGLPRPQYLVVTDPKVYQADAREIDQADVDAAFIAGQAFRMRPYALKKNMYLFGTSGLNFFQSELPMIPWIIHRTGSVVPGAVQLACYMGYSEVYVLGVDLNYDGTETHFYGGGVRERERLSKFKPGGGGVDAVNAAFRNLHAVCQDYGVSLFNATSGGRLEALPRVPLEDAVRNDHRESLPQ